MTARKVHSSDLCKIVVDLVKDFAEATVKKEEAGRELDRIFHGSGNGPLTSALEKVLLSERVYCERCNVHQDEFYEMHEDGRYCLSCASTVRGEETRKSLGLT